MSPIKVLVTGAAGQIAYSLVGLIGRGDVFGKDQPIILHLLDIAPAMPVLHGVVMELEDCSFPLLKNIVATSNEEEAFKDIDVALLVGAMPRKEGMERKDLLRANVRIFKQQGHSLDNYAKKSVKVLVVGNPANTNCLIASHFAPSLPKENFSALTRLDMNRAKAQIAAKLNISCKNVQKCIIWGNHSNTQFPDISQAVVTMPDGVVKNVTQAVKDEQWLKTVFVKCVQTRGAEVIKARKMSSAMSAAKAIGDHMKDWWFGTTEVVSMAVVSDGCYEVPKGLVFSFPVTIADGKWTIVKGIAMDDFAKEKISITTKELLQEKEDALAEVSG